MSKKERCCLAPAPGRMGLPSAEMKTMWRSRIGDWNSFNLSDICLEMSGGFIDLGLGSLEASIGGRQAEKG